MRASIETQSWRISVIVHVIMLALVSVSFFKKPPPAHKPLPPVVVHLLQPKPIPKSVTPQKQPPRKSASKQTNNQQVSALPGDRPHPKVARMFKPVYPKTALNNDWEGTVKIRVKISPKGKPVASQVISSSGHLILDQAFMRAVNEKYEFMPRRSMGENKSGYLVLSHTFLIKESP